VAVEALTELEPYMVVVQASIGISLVLNKLQRITVGNSVSRNGEDKTPQDDIFTWRPYCMTGNVPRRDKAPTRWPLKSVPATDGLRRMAIYKIGVVSGAW